MLNQGDKAPDFVLDDDEGNEVSLEGLLAGGPLILYFYPADFTPICTAEACSIRDMHPRILSANYQVVGISPQSSQSHERFRKRHDLPFPLLYDRDRRVINAFGVSGFLGMGVRRATFVIDPDRTIRARVVSDLFVGSHVEFIEQAIAKSA
ncbi:MAG: peroxiredoxin [Pseudomonadales bacterium]|nr:peroxiredoxin [Pseudomonadales bacterium]